MDISLEIPHSAYFIRSYKPGEITINDTAYRQSMVLMASKLISDWPPQSIEALTAEHLLSLLTYQPEIILLGTGTKHSFPPIEWLIPIQQAGVGIEVMSTDAAARTFNVLVSEGRNVMAALLL
ncbi:MAG: Mth938-like domain-containing protein [Gammaproteobacteria bacterium]|nr:Mth938-like domain-containing protein [Gammaproteobacteria bacterium]